MELGTKCKKFPLFSKGGLKGDFQSTLMAIVRGRLSNQ